MLLQSSDATIYIQKNPDYLADQLPPLVHTYVISCLHPFYANATSKGVCLHLQFSCTDKKQIADNEMTRCRHTDDDAVAREANGPTVHIPHFEIIPQVRGTAEFHFKAFKNVETINNG